jgi:hypothetical protein
LTSRILTLAAACVLSGCASPEAGGAPGRTPPHGVGVARRTLARDGFPWQTASVAGVHVHYLPDSYAAAHAGEFARAAQAALRHDMRLGGFPPVRDTMELFMVSTREQAAQLAGNGAMGQAIPGEFTAFFVAEPGKPPAFRHEIMHALSLKLWGRNREATWLSEGVATWAAGSCQGHTVDEVAAGFLGDGTLPPMQELAARVWEIDELHAYLTAGSAVGYLARTRGTAAVQALWARPATAHPHPLGEGGAEMEAAWRAHLATVRPAPIDLARLRRHGCEAP